MAKFKIILASSRGDEHCGTAPTRAAAFELAHQVVVDAARSARHGTIGLEARSSRSESNPMAAADRKEERR
jgi:hypothetical protein